VALVAREKAKEINRHHHIVEKTRQTVDKVAISVRDANNKHRILEKVGTGLKIVCQKILGLAENFFNSTCTNACTPTPSTTSGNTNTTAGAERKKSSATYSAVPTYQTTD